MRLQLSQPDLNERLRDKTPDLPIWEVLGEMEEKLRHSPTLLLQAPPGAGKSTIVPLVLANLPLFEGGKIVVLQPRKLAARAVASRMAGLLNQSVGEEVGYKVRFENNTGKDTRIEVLTEGLLVRALQDDATLDGISIVIFDEFHERSLHADLSFALCKEVQSILRPDLKLLLMSATLDLDSLKAGLGEVPIVKSEGRQYPVEIKYGSNPIGSSTMQGVAARIRGALSESRGDVLVFLPGQGEIKKVASFLEDLPSSIKVYPLFGELDYEEQKDAIMPDPLGRRKVVLATSIAETSLTIEGIGIVVDSGLARKSRLDLKTGLDALETVHVTKDAAEQRAGRAGRLGPGVCYRMWTSTDHARLVPSRVPQILEADLTSTVLGVAHWGSASPYTIPWITAPPSKSVDYAQATLRELEALQGNKITDVGKELVRFPAHPRIAHMLIWARKSNDPQMLSLAADLGALLDERDPLQKEMSADINLRIDGLVRARNEGRLGGFAYLEKVSNYWRRFLKVEPYRGFLPQTAIGELIMQAYPDRLAIRVNESGRYRLANGRLGRLENGDPLAQHQLLATISMNMSSKEGNIYLAGPVSFSAIESKLESRFSLAWDSRNSKLVCQKESHYAGLVIASKPSEEIVPQAYEKLLKEVLVKEGSTLLDWNEKVSSWQERLSALQVWQPESDWPGVNIHALLGRVEDWLLPYLPKIRKGEDFRKVDLLPLLQTLLTWEQVGDLERLAPPSIEVPSGSKIDLQYFGNGQAPILAVRLQELFGLKETPRVNDGKVPVVIHLLSPGYKPVQVTTDLKSFWANTYKEVKSELKRKYPRHSWPDDPLVADAVRGPIRRRIP